MKKINFKIIGLLLFLIVFEAIVFFISKLFLGTPHVIGTRLDTLTPFLPGFIYIYITWYISLIIIPYYIYSINKDSFFKYVTVFMISTLICGIIFVIYPNTIKRVDVTGTGLTNLIVKIIYFLDTPVNCLPSIHCLYSFLFIFAIFDTKNDSPVYVKVLITLFAIAVVFSTLFVKQHVIYDALASLIISCIVWIIVNKLRFYEYTKKKLELWVNNMSKELK